MMGIEDFIYKVDSICRKDLSNLVLVSERDYVTQMNALIRYPRGILWGNLGLNVHSQTLPGNIEQSIGCDSIMIFNLKNGYKIGLFEAKYPRYPSVNSNISKRSYDWDANNRFNGQLNKQNDFKKCFPQVVIWEQFIDNGKLGQQKKPFIDKEGCSCLLLEDALPISAKTPKWGFIPLKNALSANGMNLKELIGNIISCKFGQLISNATGDYLSLKILDNQTWNGTDNFSIPILSQANLSEVNEFMLINGIRNYYYFNLTPFERHEKVKYLLSLNTEESEESER